MGASSLFYSSPHLRSSSMIPLRLGQTLNISTFADNNKYIYMYIYLHAYIYKFGHIYPCFAKFRQIELKFAKLIKFSQI